MSINYTLIEDQLLALIESATSDSDPIIRLKYLRRLKKQALHHIRKEERKAAYDCRMKFAFSDIADSVGMDKKDIEYLVRVYLVDNPDKPKPKMKQRVDISDYIDLSGG